MRLRATAVTIAAAAGLVVPLSVPAEAVPTTSTVVAYVADTNGNGIAELYTRPADGSGSPTRVFQNTHHVRLPALSPDGTKIAYLMGDADFQGEPYFRLYVRSISPPGPATLLLDLDVTASVAWSADGTKLVAGAIDWPNWKYGTYVVDATGAGTPQLVPTTDKVYGEEPSLSPSGRLVAIDEISEETGEYTAIDLISLETGKRARVAGTAGGSDPVWSPDGKYIVFQKFLKTCGVGLYRVPASGGTPVTIREVPNRFLGSAEYSRDGSQLFWGESPWRECGGTGGPGDVWVAGADGTGAANVTNTPAVYEYGITVAGGTPVPADVTPPAAPEMRPARLNSTVVDLSWSPQAEDTVEYVVVRKASGDPAPATVDEGTRIYRGPARTVPMVGLIEGTVYDTYVFGIDASGNASTASVVRPVKPMRIPHFPPMARVGTSGTTTTFRANWSGPGEGYELRVGERVKKASGAWSTSPVFHTTYPSLTESHLDYTGKQGRSYYLDVRAHDGLGNTTHWAGYQRANVPIDDRWGGFAKSAGWAAKTSATRYLGTYTTTITPGAALSAKVDTSQFVVIGDKCSTCGAVKVYVDGVHRATVDTYSATAKARQVLYAGRPFASIAPHSIRLVAVGTKGRPRVSVDGIALVR